MRQDALIGDRGGGPCNVCLHGRAGHKSISIQTETGSYLSNVLMLIQHQWSRDASASCRCHDKSLQPCASEKLEMKILVIC